MGDLSPMDQYVSSSGASIERVTNNVTEYSSFIEILVETISLRIWHLIVNIDSQLAMSQMNGVYRVYDPTFMQKHLPLRLIKWRSELITYIHIPRRVNDLTDALVNVFD